MHRWWRHRQRTARTKNAVEHWTKFVRMGRALKSDSLVLLASACSRRTWNTAWKTPLSRAWELNLNQSGEL
jgi:hypothetical protein